VKGGTTGGKNVRIASITLVLLLAAALRMHGVIEFIEWPDEIFTVWNAQGTLADRLIHIDPYWPPLHGYLVWGWRQIAGDSLEVQRFLSMLIGLLALAFVYKAAHTLNPKAALPAALAYAVMGYAVFSGVDVRGYSLLLLFLPLALWQTLRWLRAPTRKRAVLVMLGVAGMLYSGFSAPAFIAFLTLWVLLTRPRLFPYWVGIGVGVFILVLPIVPQFLMQNVLGRFAVVPAPLPPFFEALAGIYRDFGGSIAFLVLLAAAAIIVAAAAVRYPHVRRKALLLTLWVLFPALLYVTVANRDFWRPRYMWWVLPGLACFIGYAAALLIRFAKHTSLNRAARALPLVALTGLLLIPVDDSNYRLSVTESPPFRSVFAWFAERLRPGDVLIVDPYCTCGGAEGWSLFVPQYFPTGYLPIVDRPGDASRVWYLSNDGWQRDQELLAEIEHGRTPSIFVGPWFFLLRLYEGAPWREGVDFGGQVRLHGFEIERNLTALRERERFNVRLWWAAAEALNADYSISLAVLDPNGQVVAQADGPARAPNTPEATSSWLPGTIYEDVRTLELPGDLNSGPYRLVITVYQWWDGVRLLPASDALENGYMLLTTLDVVAF
jgi:hypothetical protein